jgi:acetyl-CoA carboxylase biotin carboxylase subunit
LIKRLLIADRGEIAVRIIRTCREMGIETVAVYSTADKESLHARLADKAVCIGPPPAAQSYLDGNNLIMAAVNTGCEALHPGVGFLSEDAGFARTVRARGLIFIGPDPEVLEHAADRLRIRKTAQELGIPLIPGSGEAAADLRSVKKAAAELGFPVLIKAGNQGAWIARSGREIEKKFSAIKRKAALNGAGFFIEQYLDNPRQVEFQIIANGMGKVAVLGEQDCSIQKNHRKLIEESPSPGVSRIMRKDMSEEAAKLFRALNYRGAGTLSFLVQGEQRYFLDVTARLRTGHPVSEQVTGADILRQQLLACLEGRMEMSPASLRISGWAMECRINALGPGIVAKLEIPGGPGVRFDSCLYEGCSVPSLYDSLVAKVIVHGPNRLRALARMDRALEELTITGIDTDKSQQQRIIRDEAFRSGSFGTAFYDKPAPK